jgi:hypothetical protein
VMCGAGTSNCDGSDVNGCETRTSTDVNNCGAGGSAGAGCGVRCPSTGGAPSCSGGVCSLACNTGFGNCDSDAANGCETNTQTSTTHCGACGRTCTATQTCSAGNCVSRCPAGMQFIPSGMLLMGDVQGVQLSAFCMGSTEVTLAEWRSCTAPGCTTPNTGGACNFGVVGRDSHPVNCVDWLQARAYCQWRGGDLATEAQWEYAARGAEGRLYPWGNTPVPGSQLCWSGGGTSRSTTCAVASFPAGSTQLGLLDMAGNIWEWVADWHAPYTGTASSYVLNPTGPASGTDRVFRGGSWVETNAGNYRMTYRRLAVPTNRSPSIGFRCARAAL